MQALRDDRAPRQRARRRRAEHLALRQTRRPDPGAAARRDRRRARQGDHPVDRAARAEARRERPGADAGGAAPGARRQGAAGHGSRARRRRAPATPATVVLPGAQGRGGHRPRPAQRQADARREQPPGGQLHADQRRARASSARSTGENIGRLLAIVLDNRVQSAPRIDGRITDEGADHRQLHAAGSRTTCR